MSVSCVQETLYLDASLYEYRSVELLMEVSMSLVWRLVSAGVNGRLGALESHAQRRHHHRQDAVPPGRRPAQAPGGLPQERDSRPCVDRPQRRRRPVLGEYESTNLNGPPKPQQNEHVQCMCSAKNVSAVPPAT